VNPLVTTLVVAVLVTALLGGCALIECIADRFDARRRPQRPTDRVLRAVAPEDLDDGPPSLRELLAVCPQCGGRP
jgi:hypothetical protein